MLHHEAKSPLGHFWFAVVLEVVLVVIVVGVVLVVVAVVSVVGIGLVVGIGVVLVISFICDESAEAWLQVLQQIFE